MKDINYKIGSSYVKDGNYNRAVPFLKKAVEEGNFDAANDLGVIHEENEMYNQALAYYKTAGCNGSATALHNLGNLYEKGLGVKRDLITARKYFENSAKLGYPSAYKRLAKLYLFGMGVEKDLKKTIYYLKQGAKLEKKKGYKYTECTDALAFNYSEGLGVKQSDKKAYKLWKISAKHGDFNGLYNIALCYLFGEVVKENTDLALEMLIDLACQHHYEYAFKTLSKIFYSDDFGMKDLKEAGHWLIEGCKYGEVHCYLKVAEICLSDKGQDYGFHRDFSKQAILDFLKTTDGLEQEYEEEISEYSKLKETYINNIDWEYLETLPESIEDKKQTKELC